MRFSPPRLVVPRFPLSRLGAAAALLASSLAAAQAPAPTPVLTPPPPTVDFVPTSLLSVPDDLEVTLWARAPMLHNPTNMDIDSAGRIWVTEGVNYRSHAKRQPAGDRVVVLEDTDGDGQADKSSTFVQEPTLVAPLGIAVIDNQIIVSNAPDLIVYTDVNRNGRFDPAIDKREVLLTGFNGRNHDHSLHSVTVGPDGRWYFNQGNAGAMFTDRSGKTFRFGSIYNPVANGGGEPVFGWTSPDIAGAKSDDGHVYVGGVAMRMRPDGRDVEVIGYNFRNSYEQTITSFGDVFQNDNDDPPACRTTFLMEYGNMGFFSADGQRMWNADRRPGQTIPVAEWKQEDPRTIPAGDVYGGGAPTGMAFYEGDALGAKWRGVLLSGEAARNTVFGYFPKADGAGYQLDRFDFITSNREQKFAGTDFRGGMNSITNEVKTLFRPSDVAVGPDGAIYVADWFDGRVGGHQDLDSNTAGAIYRIAPKGFKSVVPKFDLATTEGQITALKSPAVNVRSLGYTRLHAQGDAAVAPVSALLDDPNPYIRARAVWLLAELGRNGVAKVESLTQHPDAMIRVAAFRALRRTLNPKILSFAATLARDSSPVVRREVALAMRDVPLADARPILVTLAAGYDGQDRSYLAAWGIGCSGKEDGIYDALAAKQEEKDAVKWSAAYANLVWRLTPTKAVASFAARANATTLSEADRLAAITALGYIPARESAFALVDLAQKTTGKPQAHAVWWLLNYKDTRWAEANLNSVLKERGIYNPDKIVITESVVPPQPPTQLPPVAEIAALAGDAKRGASLVTVCYTCHHIGDTGPDYAPNLTGFASRQTTQVVIDAIANPSNDISHGYEGTEIKTKDGKIINGLLLSASDPVIIQSMGGVQQFIPTSAIEYRRPMRRSLMLSGEQLGLKAQDIADVVAFLKTK
jgi:putative membrane-bound dehydrogenase-like protein